MISGIMKSIKTTITCCVNDDDCNYTKIRSNEEGVLEEEEMEDLWLRGVPNENEASEP